jgi:hypothetical protein
LHSKALVLKKSRFKKNVAVQKEGTLINLHQQDLDVRNQDFKRYKRALLHRSTGHNFDDPYFNKNCLKMLFKNFSLRNYMIFFDFFIQFVYLLKMLG